MSLPYIVDGETDADSTVVNAWIDAMNGTSGPLANMRAGVANVLDYSGTATEKLKSALADLSSAGGGTAVVKGELELTERIIVPANVRIANGSFWSEAVLRPAGGFADSALLQGSADVAFEDITVDLDMDATCLYGISIQGNGTRKRASVRRCNIKNAAGRAITAWTSNAIWITENQIEDSVTGIYIDDSSAGGAWVAKNQIVSTVAGRMKYGIRASAASTKTTCTLVTQLNYVEGADYATASSAEAHGISFYRAPGARSIGDIVTKCGNPANTQGVGIFLGIESWGAAAIGSQAFGNYNIGFFVELTGSDTGIGSLGAGKGALLDGVLAHGNAGYGIGVSYSPATIVTGAVAYENGFGGIYGDADRCTVAASLTYNNWQDSGASAPAQNGGSKAGIRYYGANGILTGNHSFDNQAAPTQPVGMAVENRDCIITGNQLRGTDALYENGGGTANTKSANVEQDV